VTNEIDTLATALYVKTDDLLKDSPELAPWRPRVGIAPKLTANVTSSPTTGASWSPSSADAP
jgi:hypothetical protein